MKTDPTLKKFYNIGEVADIIGVATSNLRFWEKEFTIIKPHRSTRGTRMYTPEDIETIRMIYYLVKEKGLTLAGAQKQLKVNKNNISKQYEVVKRLKSIKTELLNMIAEYDNNSKITQL